MRQDAGVAETTPPVIRSTITDDEFGGFRITIHATGDGRCALTFLYIASDPARHSPGGVTFLAVLLVFGLVLGFLTAHAWTFRQVLMIEGKTHVLRRKSIGTFSELTFDLAGVRNLRPGRPAGEGAGHVLVFGSSLWAEFDLDAMGISPERLGEFDGRHVVVTATVNREYQGYFSLWPGAVAIRAVTKSKGAHDA
jgi:hypothetical protein